MKVYHWVLVIVLAVGAGYLGSNLKRCEKLSKPSDRPLVLMRPENREYQDVLPSQLGFFQEAVEFYVPGDHKVTAFVCAYRNGEYVPELSYFAEAARTGMCSLIYGTHRPAHHAKFTGVKGSPDNPHLTLFAALGEAALRNGPTTYPFFRWSCASEIYGYGSSDGGWPLEERVGENINLCSRTFRLKEDSQQVTMTFVLYVRFDHEPRESRRGSGGTGSLMTLPEGIPERISER